MRVYYSVQLTGLLVTLSIILPSCAQTPPINTATTHTAGALSLDGKSFPGRIRMKGFMGFYGVSGTLEFKDGTLTWSAKSSMESAPYEVAEADGTLKFTSQVPGDGGTYVDWSGTYDGISLSNVTAIWFRAEENDFIHDLFLPDVVTFIFTPEEN